MRLTLDTNAYTAFCLGEDQVLQLMESADELLIPAVVIGELVSGFVQGSRKQENLDLLDAFLAQPGVFMQPIARRATWLCPMVNPRRCSSFGILGLA